jgi:hypothetical protein
VGDLENNGYVDVVFVDMNYLYVNELPYFVESFKPEWNYLYYDEANTGCYNCDSNIGFPVVNDSRPQSKVVNNEDFDLNGTLSLILQRKIGDQWRYVELVTGEEVTIPAHGLIKLDVGEPYGWNLKNVFANQPGKYRVYGSFEVGEKKVETAWEFDVLYMED